MKASLDACGCFPTGRHYPGIAHLLSVVVRGVAEELGQDTDWRELRIALIDVETTGRDVATDRVVEVGVCIGVNGEIVERYKWLVNPGIPIPDEARAVHGISDADVKSQPTFAQVAAQIAEVLHGCVPGAYNAAFDRAFIHGEMARAAVSTNAPTLRRDVDWLDPLVWARYLQAEEKSRALGDVAGRLGIKLEGAHRADADAEAALRVLYTLGRDPRVPRSYGAFVQEQRRYNFAQADERRFWKS